jgi:DNA-binding response OmpR family regulator
LFSTWTRCAAGGALRPDVIVADYHLDHGTGLDLIVSLRAALAAGAGKRA